MPAYLIATVKITDRHAFFSGGYPEEAARLTEAYGGRYVAPGSGATVLEGDLDTPLSVMISEWESKDAVLTFWNSEDYAAAKTLREGSAECQVLVVEA